MSHLVLCYCLVSSVFLSSLISFHLVLSRLVTLTRLIVVFYFPSSHYISCCLLFGLVPYCFISSIFLSHLIESHFVSSCFSLSRLIFFLFSLIAFLLACLVSSHLILSLLFFLILPHCISFGLILSHLHISLCLLSHLAFVFLFFLFFSFLLFSFLFFSFLFFSAEVHSVVPLWNIYWPAVERQTAPKPKI